MRTARVVDIDSHFYEPADWLTRVDPELGEKIPTVSMKEMILDPAMAPEIPADLELRTTLFFGPEYLPHLMRVHGEQPATFNQAAHDPYYDPDGRVELLDQLGIDVQFVNPTMAFAESAARFYGQDHLIPRLRGAWNTFAAEQVDGHSDRLMPVTQIDIEDVDFSVKEMTRMRARGSRAFNLAQPTDRSLSHPDFEPLWSAAGDLGMAAYVHAGFGAGTAVHPSWGNNGGTNPVTMARLNRLFGLEPVGQPFAVQLLLSVLTTDGVLERHPDVPVLIAECGFTWLPYLLRVLDWNTKVTDFRADEKDAAERLKASAGTKFLYDLPLTPSEYIKRQVRVTPLIGNIQVVPWEKAMLQQTATELAELGASEVFVFSSDYPHPEGRPGAVELFDAAFPLDDLQRERFLGGSIAELVGL